MYEKEIATYPVIQGTSCSILLFYLTIYPSLKLGIFILLSSLLSSSTIDIIKSLSI